MMFTKPIITQHMIKYALIIFGLFFCWQNSIAQGNKEEAKPAENWFLLDAKKDKLIGTSTELAYKTILKKKKSETVIVAVIDSGVDIDHEDLKDNIWVNTDEIPENGIDDDQNGYVDDVNGWNFLGGPNGNVQYENYELARLYKKLKPIYGENLPEGRQDDPQYDLWIEVRDSLESEIKKLISNYQYYESLQGAFEWYTEYLQGELATDSLTIEAINKINTSDTVLLDAQQFMQQVHQYFGSVNEGFKEILDYFDKEVKRYDMRADYRSIVGDNPDDVYERNYGNNDVTGPDAQHGTHVAGIIAAVRNNKIGIDGMADNVKIMPIRAVPDGDEYDKDVANAIYYAVDNGAQIINMSFGKFYSPNKEVVDKAVKYAEEKGVLLVHGAGNENLDIDQYVHYPSRIFTDGTRASNWIEVGAIAHLNDENFVADFSNYGPKELDVFAPGVAIYSTVPDNKYEWLDGTSMAAPVVSGLAALLKSYFTSLSAQQIKDIIAKSVVVYPIEVVLPGTEDEKIAFNNLSNTGGVVNTLKAVKLAEEISK